jgi:hypothetical protein
MACLHCSLEPESELGSGIGELFNAQQGGAAEPLLHGPMHPPPRIAAALA